MAGEQQIEQLLVIHKPQLAASIPERHWRSLLRKLATGQMDAGATFGLTYENEAEAETRLKAVVVKEEGVKVRGLLDPEVEVILRIYWIGLY